MGKWGAGGIIAGELGLGKNLSESTDPTATDTGCPRGSRRPTGTGAGGRFAVANIAPSAIRPRASVVSCRLFKSQHSSYFTELPFLPSVFGMHEGDKYCRSSPGNTKGQHFLSLSCTRFLRSFS